jgi:hypothetical protein
MAVVLAADSSPGGVRLVAKKSGPASSKMPTSPTVKLDKQMFEDVWWAARVEGKSPGEILKEIAGVQAAARRKRHETAIAKLAKLDEAEDEIVTQAKQSAE